MTDGTSRFNFTVSALLQVTCPPSHKADKSGRVYVYDTKVPGLTFCVTEGGARSYYLYRRVNGKPQRIKIGTEAEFTIERARRRAGELNSEIAQGMDPQAKKAAARADAVKGATVGDMWTAFEAGHMGEMKPGTAKEYRRHYEAHIATWKNRAASEISSEDCEILKTRVGKNGKYAANRVLAVVSSMFSNVGHRFGLVKKWTPTTGVEKYPEHARDRVLSPEELAEVLASIDAEGNEIIRDYFRMLLYTGARKSNVAEMSWQNVSEQRKTWSIPGEQFKNGSPLVVTLVPEALEILTRRHKNNPSDSPFVFPARYVTSATVDEAKALREGGLSTYEVAKKMGISQTSVVNMTAEGYTVKTPTCFDGAGVAWARILKRAGIKERTTIHDIRRTFCTNLIEAGIPLPHVSAALGHRSMETTQKHYAIARLAHVADAHQVGVAAMLAGAQKAAKAKVRAAG